MATLIWQQRKGGGNDSHYIAVDHEYILIFAKNFASLNERWRITQSEEYLTRYKETEIDGRRYYWDTLVRNGLQSPIVINFRFPPSSAFNCMTAWAVVAEPEKKSIIISFDEVQRVCKSLIRLVGFA